MNTPYATWLSNKLVFRNFEVSEVSKYTRPELMSYREIFGDSTPIWELSLDAFIKFQLKRKMLEANGVAPFLKQTSKMIKDLKKKPSPPGVRRNDS